MSGSVDSEEEAKNLLEKPQANKTRKENEKEHMEFAELFNHMKRYGSFDFVPKKGKKDPPRWNGSTERHSSQI